MGTYIARRLLLMIPTLLGITLIVFLIVAAAPGGIGASLMVSGGQMDPTSAALRQAELEDRYGLDDPILVQYGRWLRQISPLKFGRRSLVDPAGNVLSVPRRPKPPVLWDWFADDLNGGIPQAEPVSWAADITAEEKAVAYREQAQAFARARIRAAGSRRLANDALARYAHAAKIAGAVNSEGKVREGVLRSSERNTALPEWKEAAEAAAEAIDAYRDAVRERRELIAVFDAKPFPEAGVAIIPGAVSLAAPDLGRSFSKSRPVIELIGDALPVTLLLNFIAVPIIYLVAVPSGMLAAVRQGSWLDVLSGGLYVALWSFPIPLAGVLAVGYLASDAALGWFPAAGMHSAAAENWPFLPGVDVQGQWTAGYFLDMIWHLCLPIACLVYGGFAVLSKQTRASMLDNFNADYVRTAKAKGVPYKDVIFRHVFRNSLLPLITIFVGIFPTMLAGSVVVEKIFSVPGMGRLVLDAIYLRDRELVLATTLIIAGVNLLALLLADILYALADPRISYE